MEEKKLPDEIKDYLFKDVKPVKFTNETKSNPNNKNVSGNVRISEGMYRTDEEKEKYVKESLERELP